MNISFNLEKFVYLIIFLLPSYLVRFRFWLISTNLLEILIIVLLIFWLTQRKNIKLRIRNAYQTYQKYLLPISAILVGLFVSTFLGKDYYQEIGIIKGWFIFPLLLAFLVQDIISKEKRKNIFLTLFFSAFWVAFLALLYWWQGFLTYDNRLEAFFNSPNYLAMYLALGAIVGGWKIYLDREIDPEIVMKNQNAKHKTPAPTRLSSLDGQLHNLKFKSSLIFCWATILVTLYFTYSYAAWIALAFSLGTVFFLNNRRNKKWLLGGVIIVFFILLSQLPNQKFHDLITLDERSSFSSRLMIWRSAIHIIQDNFMFGIGPGNFQAEYLAYQKYYPPYLEWAVPHPHNLFLAFWLYAGLVGLVGFLALVIYLFKDLYKGSKKTPCKYMALGILVYIILHGLIDTTYFKNDLAIIFWVLLTVTEE